jgi:hypothetical protein
MYRDTNSWVEVRSLYSYCLTTCIVSHERLPFWLLARNRETLMSILKLVGVGLFGAGCVVSAFMYRESSSSSCCSLSGGSKGCMVSTDACGSCCDSATEGCGSCPSADVGCGAQCPSSSGDCPSSSGEAPAGDIAAASTESAPAELATAELATAEVTGSAQ